MSSGRNRKNKRRRSSRRNPNISATPTPEPKHVKTCINLLNQITALNDAKDFHKLLSTHHELYRDYKKINSNPISFSYVNIIIFLFFYFWM